LFDERLNAQEENLLEVIQRRDRIAAEFVRQQGGDEVEGDSRDPDGVRGSELVALIEELVKKSAERARRRCGPETPPAWRAAFGALRHNGWISMASPHIS
jgi:hypothetical protein